MRDIIDWDYYKERLGGTIQKILVIPCALQGKFEGLNKRAQKSAARGSVSGLALENNQGEGRQVLAAENREIFHQWRCEGANLNRKQVKSGGFNHERGKAFDEKF